MRSSSLFNSPAIPEMSGVCCVTLQVSGEILHLVFCVCISGPASVVTMLVAPLLLVLFVPFSPSSGAQLPNQAKAKDLPIATNGQPFPWDRMRLPTTVTPLHYDLAIHPNLTTLDFTGVVRIELDVHEDTNTVILHAKQMQISDVFLLAPEGIKRLEVLEYPRFHQLALLSDSVLIKGRKYEVHLAFAANLSDSFHGFYKGSYRTSSGEVR